jgi:hypothetical protein
LPGLAFPEILWGGQSLYWTDLSWIHFPRHIFAAGEWLAGRPPLWDPYEDLGIPLLAETQVGALYPLSLLFLGPFSPARTLALFILIHHTLAALFTYILARSLAMGRPAAVVAGLAFGLGGFLMAQVPNLNIMAGAAWLPLILYGVTRLKSWPAALLAGVPLAVQILVAQPQIVFYTLVVVAGYGVYQISTDFFSSLTPTLSLGERGAGGEGPMHRAVRTALFFAVAVGTGLLLAAPQLLPTWELQQLSVRDQARGLEFLTENSLPPAMWLNLLLPGAFGNNVVGFQGGDPFQEVFVYIGFIPLLLLPFGWGERAARFFWLLLLAGALLAMGGHTPLYEYVMQHLPGFALFRIPARWLMVVNLALAMLAGFGLERLLREGVSRAGLRLLWLWCGLLLIGLLLAWSFQADLLTWSRALPPPYDKFAVALLNNAFVVNLARYEHHFAWHRPLAPALLLAGNIAAAASLFTLFATRWLSRDKFALLLIAAVSFDLVAAGGTTINPFQPDTWWWELSGGAKYVLERLPQEEAGRVFPLGMGSEAATVSHLGQYFPSAYRIHSAGFHGSSLRLARKNKFLHEADPVQALKLLGVRYLLTEGPMGADVAATYPLAYSDADSYVYENKDFLPRTFIVHRAIQAQDEAEALAHFQVRAVDPRQTVILEAEESLPPLPDTPPDGESRATILSENPQAVEIEATLAGDGYLVLLDTFYPGWRATVDGQERPIYRANYLVRALYLPGGTHQVRFEYRPFSFKLGLIVALVTGVVVATVCVYSIGSSRTKMLLQIRAK